MTEREATGVEELDYTELRNEILDVIIPEVTEKCQQGVTAGMILLLIEKKAADDHKDCAEVSVQHMMAFMNGSRSDVSRARAWLIAEGYVELISGGTGLDTSNLRIVLDAQERARLKESRNSTI